MIPDGFSWLESLENVVMLTDVPQEAVWSQFVMSRALARVNKTLKQTSTKEKGRTLVNGEGSL